MARKPRFCAFSFLVIHVSAPCRTRFAIFARKTRVPLLQNLAIARFCNCLSCLKLLLPVLPISTADIDRPPSPVCIFYIFCTVEHDNSPLGKSLGGALAQPFAARRSLLHRRDGYPVPAQRGRRSGATASPFRRNGITVSRQLNTRFGRAGRAKKGLSTGSPRVFRGYLTVS